MSHFELFEIAPLILQPLSAAGASPYSNITTVETPAAPPSPVNDIKVVSIAAAFRW